MNAKYNDSKIHVLTLKNINYCKVYKKRSEISEKLLNVKNN